jgi:hypothetical protein
MAALQVTSLAFGRVGKLVNQLSKKLRAQFLGHGQASMLKHVCVQLTLGSFAKRLPVSVVYTLLIHLISFLLPPHSHWAGQSQLSQFRSSVAPQDST